MHMFNSNNNDNRCAIYLREFGDDVSESGYKLDEQNFTCKTMAGIRNYAIVDTYIDTISSSTLPKDRPGLTRLINDAKESKFGYIMIFSIDRLCINLRMLNDIVDFFEHLGINIISCRENIIDTSTPSGKFILQIFSSFMELEREMSLRLRREELQEEIPYGYIKVDNKIESNGTKSKIIQTIFYKKYDGRSKESIINELNNSKIPSPSGQEWTKNDIRNIYTKEKLYMGEPVGKFNLSYPVIIEDRGGNISSMTADERDHYIHKGVEKRGINMDYFRN